jgi:hypothetical protein
MKWREVLVVLYDKRIPMRLKGKFYRSVVRPTMVYGYSYMVQCWTVDRRIKQCISVAEMKMLRWISGVTREDIRRKKYVRRTIGIVSIVDKMRENRLR